MRGLMAAAVALAAWTSGAAAQTWIDVTPPPGVQLPPGTPASTLLPALVEHSRSVATLENGRLSGVGAELLRSLGQQSQFVLIGEDHGNARIAQFAEAYWRELNAVGFQYAAIETDPWTSAALERELRAGGVSGWTRFVEPRGGALAAPFFTWTHEAQFAATIVETSSARSGALWGLDQVFIGGAQWQLRAIAEGAHDSEARRIATMLVEHMQTAGPNGLISIEPEMFEALRARLTQRRDAAHLAHLDAIMVSQRIYRPFTGGGGDAHHANIERETLMKRLFLERYREAERRDRAPPRVMFKFGANHMFRGASTTHVQGLGGFVTEFGVANGHNTLSLFVVCGPGGFVGTFERSNISCTEPFNERYGFLAPYVDVEHVTIFDLRSWRTRPGRWAHLPAETQRVIDAFDLLVVVPNGANAQFLPGLPAPQIPNG